MGEVDRRSTSHDVTSALHRFHKIRAATERLIEPLSAEDCSAQSMLLSSPVKWHLAHTSWFFETFLLTEFLNGYEAFDPEFRVLFNSYYHGVGAQFDRPSRGLLTRPDLNRVLQYRRHVDAGIEALLLGQSNVSGVLTTLELGINHEEQHQELILTDVKHLLSLNPTSPVYRKPWPLTTVHPATIAWLPLGGGESQIGADASAFSFDNECPRHAVAIRPFELANRPVTNEEFLSFIDDGGYQRPELWLDRGWAVCQEQGWQAPEYWRRSREGWRCFTLHGECDLDPSAPVCHISFYEAEAYARWAGARLPTEAEWELASSVAATTGNFVESGVLHPCGSQQAACPGLAMQMFGDVWEWTRSDYAPYPGFKVGEGAIGEYNGKFMSGQYVLRGGSCVTPERHIRPTYRNFFPPEVRWQFSGVRLARDIESPAKTSMPADFLTVPHGDEGVADEALVAGLREPEARLPAAMFYDSLGSTLFEAITKLPEYYQTRTEAAIFDDHIAEMATRIRSLLGVAYQMVDVGAGSCEKAERLLPALQPVHHVAVDVSADYLKGQLQRLRKRFPDLPITGVDLDFAHPFELPTALAAEARLIFYPGSSLGNFAPDYQHYLLQQMAAGAGRAGLLMGLDLVKDLATLRQAYDDAVGVTAAFNRNALAHANRRLGCDFAPAEWRHIAVFNDQASRIEMHLEATAPTSVALPGGSRHFAAGERILTEHSYKWHLADIQPGCEIAGFVIDALWVDPEEQFAVVLALQA